MRPNTVATSIVDKNGKQTTVHKKAYSDNPSNARVAKVASPKMQTSEPEPFVYDRKTFTFEQVEPYYDDYLAIREELEAAGKYPYNASFSQRIPGLSNTTPRNEESAIYYLQTLHTKKQEDEQERKFLESGGRIFDKSEVKAGEVIRGDIVERNFYSSGTGWAETKGVRIIKEEAGGAVMMMKKNAKSYGRSLQGSHFLIRESTKK